MNRGPSHAPVVSLPGELTPWPAARDNWILGFYACAFRIARAGGIRSVQCAISIRTVPDRAFVRPVAIWRPGGRGHFSQRPLELMPRNPSPSPRLARIPLMGRF